MNKSASASEMYATELDARTAFILNPTRFLMTVGNAVSGDETVPETVAMIKMLLKHDYPRTIAKAVSSDRNDVRSIAMWCLANLLGANTPALREAAVKAVTSALDLEVVMDVLSHQVPGSTGPAVDDVVFLLENICRFVVEELSDDTLQTIVQAVTGFHTDYISPRIAWALYYVAARQPKLVEPTYIIRLFNMSVDYYPLLRILGELAARTGLLESVVPDALNLLESLIVYRGIDSKHLPETLWVLSNVVTEAGAADTFVDNFSELFDFILRLAKRDADDKVKAEATWVLANTVARAKGAAIRRALVDNGALDGLFWSLLSHDKKKLRTIASEAIDNLRKYRDELPPKTPEGIVSRLKAGYNADLVVRLGEFAEEEGGVATCLSEVFSVVGNFLITRDFDYDFTWILSNALTEDGSATAFLDVSGLIDRVIDLTFNDERRIQREALIVLRNLVKEVEERGDVALKRRLMTDTFMLYGALQTAMDDFMTARNAALADEILTSLNLMSLEQRAVSVTEWALPADGDNEEWTLHADEAPIAATQSLDEAFILGETEQETPNALTLLHGYSMYGRSAALRRLVSALMASGNLYGTVEIPADMVFTAADLQAVHAMGYYVWNNRFGISTYLTGGWSG